MTEHDLTEKQEQIVTALEPFQPRPTEEFYERMSAMPWKISAKKTLPGLQFAAVILTVFVVFVTLFLAVPSLRTLAQEVIGRLFSYADGDSKEFSYTAVATPSGNDVLDFTIEQLAEQATFDITTPSFVPEGFSFTGGTWAATQSTLYLLYDYTGGGRLLQIMETTDAEAFNTELYSEVGASAHIEIVQIGSVTGEYVVGAWAVYEPHEAAPGEAVTEEAVWLPDASARRLRWQNNDIFYEILSGGGSEDHPGFVGRDEMIQIAESME